MHLKSAWTNLELSQFDEQLVDVDPFSVLGCDLQDDGTASVHELAS